MELLVENCNCSDRNHSPRQAPVELVAVEVVERPVGHQMTGETVEVAGLGEGVVDVVHQKTDGRA